MSRQPPGDRGPEPTAAQWRVITAALKLFAEHGVGGTSLRMIAAELGVTMAAVYHQFHTKDEIIFAAVESELRRLEAVVDAAEAQPTVTKAREAMLTGMVDMTIGVGRSVSTVLNDPAVTGSFSRHAGYRDLLRRIRVLLMDDSTSREARVRTATLIAAINGTATHPLVADLDDETLRHEVLFVARRLLPPRPRHR
ncbi:MAG TPA: helix-turn-helix domain-containing protein [Acidimicrobiales bacterium]|nr:helix-turn-helix domain-containing protein [Acidimicrobiales bacterium]